MSTLEQSIAIATRAIAQLDAGNSSECDAILSGHGQQIARDFLRLARVVQPPTEYGHGVSLQNGTVRAGRL